MKLYKCIISDRSNGQVFQRVTAAKNKKELLSVYGGNGDFEKITDVTNDYPIDIDFLRNTLETVFGEGETALITELVQAHMDGLK